MRITSLIVTLLLFNVCLAQPPKPYTVTDGKMVITLPVSISDDAIDSFVRKYELFDLALKKFIRTGYGDSLRIAGWDAGKKKDFFVISKSLKSPDGINDPADVINLYKKDPDFSMLFPSVSNSVKYGVNNFIRKNEFTRHDSLVTFILRERNMAGKVRLAGSFNNWNPDDIVMVRTDSGWIANVKLGPGKYWYKFIVDGYWITDPENRLKESDGMGNINSVYFRPNIDFTLKGFSSAKKVVLAGSFNNWHERELQMEKTGTGWRLPIYLANGTHTYRYIVDGRWMEDPDNPEKLPNEFGEFNSMIRLGKPFLFLLEGYSSASKVTIAGTFNNWKMDELFLKKTEKGWELPYTLAPGNYEFKIFADRKQVQHSPLIIEPNTKFSLKGFTESKQVFLAGSFNDWNPFGLPMKKQGDEWIVEVHLSRGKHLYKFIVDGEWIKDPANKLWEENEVHTGNSVIWKE